MKIILIFIIIFTICSGAWFFTTCGGVHAAESVSQPVPLPDLEKQLKKTSVPAQRLALLVQLVTRCRQEAPQKAELYGQQALTILKDLHDDDGKLQILNGMCWAYGVLGRFREALDTGKKAELLTQQLDNKKEEAVTYGTLANIYLDLSEFHKALDYSLKAKAASETIGYKKGEASALVSTARIQVHLKEFDKALINYQQALDLSTQLENRRNVAWILSNTATVYWNLKQYKRALDFYFRALDMMKQLGSKIGNAFILNNISCVYNDIGQYKKALQFDLKALKLYEQLASKSNTGYAYRNIGRDYGNLGQFQKGLTYLDKSLGMAGQMGIKDLEKTVYQEYSRLYESMGKYKKALHYHKKFKVIEDRTLNEDRNRRIAHLQVVYDVEKKQKENQILKKNNHIQQLELERRNHDLDRQKMLRNFLILVTLLVIVISLITYNRYLIRKKAQEVLQVSEGKLKNMNAAKDKLFTIIAHDLAGPLNSLLLSSGHLNRNFKQLDEDALEDFIRIIFSQTEGLSDLLENLLQWARVQTGKINCNPEIVDLHEVISETKKQVQYATGKKKISLASNVMENSVAWADKHMIKTIIRNLVANAVKYTHPGGRITIDAEDTGDCLEISVADNGVGIEEERVQVLFSEELHESTRGTANEKGTGLGLTLCKEFVESSGGEIRIQSRPREGSRFSFTLPKQG